ncbi:CBS domain-containing protein [Nesterenkonia salmonea]|uniref:CBS domain-containing protein n=1 Tax=Nesterenkonia salmonea TaxID=1804987 RepID=A0A5R9BC77_9MICC|nr:CBS domain-containing protein [Nesterenkonia salmonea]TLP96787.1 CBS domain-containing protein [Nesterenkonia salmonea]
MTHVSDLMSPITSVISMTQSVAEAAQFLSGEDDAVLVLGMTNQPRGLITEEAVAQVIAEYPETWPKKRCACVIPEELEFVRPDDTAEEVIRLYKDGGARPLTVVENDYAVGILYPNPVFLESLEQPESRMSGSSE